MSNTDRSRDIQPIRPEDVLKWDTEPVLTFLERFKDMHDPDARREVLVSDHISGQREGSPVMSMIVRFREVPDDIKTWDYIVFYVEMRPHDGDIRIDMDNCHRDEHGERIKPYRTWILVDTPEVAEHYIREAILMMDKNYTTALQIE